MRTGMVVVWILPRGRNLAAILLLALTAFFVTSFSAGAQQVIKVGTTKLSSTAPLFIAMDKRYFAAEGLSADVVIFDAAQPVSMGVTSGDLDFGVTAVSGAFYSLAAQGSQKIIARHGARCTGLSAIRLRCRQSRLRGRA